MKGKITIVVISVLFWLLAVIIHARYSILYGLQNAGDGYDTEWQFQLMAFTLTKFPFYLIGLVLLLIIELSLFSTFYHREN